MISELRHVDPARAAKVAALVYALLTAAFALVAAPFVLLGPAPVSGSRTGTLVFLSLYPLLGLLGGWIGGFLAASAYNLVARRVGGVRFEIAASDEQQLA